MGVILALGGAINKAECVVPVRTPAKQGTGVVAGGC